jgi:hypothetical protein
MLLHQPPTAGCELRGWRYATKGVPVVLDLLEVVLDLLLHTGLLVYEPLELALDYAQVIVQ